MERDSGSLNTNCTLLEPYTPPQALAVIVGADPLSRAEIIYNVWEHIRQKKLWDPSDGSKIVPDTVFQTVFNKDSLTADEVSVLLQRHWIK